MKLVDTINAGALSAAMVLAVLVACVGSDVSSPSSPEGAAKDRAGTEALLQRTTLPDGGSALTDATGTAVRVGGYRRVISLAHPSDQLLALLCDPGRVVAFSRFSNGPSSYLLGDKPRLSGLDDIEAIMALHPDLVLLSAAGGDGIRMAHLRASGIAVYDLGDQTGLRSLEAEAMAIGTLLEMQRPAELFVASLARRMAQVHDRLTSAHPRRRALVVMAVGTLLYGGTLGSSYHDILEAAGLIDVAAQRYRGWPQYRSEEVIGLDPDLIITARGMKKTLAQVPDLAAMRAFTQSDGIIEMDDDVLSDAGPAMLEASESLFQLAYPEVAAAAR